MQSEFAGKTATILGGSATGASWAALFLANGLKVIISDPDPDIPPKATEIIAEALRTIDIIRVRPFDIAECLSFESDDARAVADAFLVQECGPERAAFKQAMWRTIEVAAPPDALLCSSSSFIPASVQQAEMEDHTRLIVAHPFSHPHLTTLVEVVPTPTTDPEVTAGAVAFYDGMGMVARIVRKEVSGLVASRLAAAAFREAVSLICQGVVTIDELDDIVTASLGPRWATSGPFLLFHIGGNAGGLHHFTEHHGMFLEQLWLSLGEPRFDEATKTLIAKQAEASYGTSSIESLSKYHSAKEAAVIHALNDKLRSFFKTNRRFS